MARDVAIDLGTANTLVYQKNKGILFAEPTVLALNKETGAVLAMGEEAWRMIGRTPGYIVAVRPLRSGARPQRPNGGREKSGGRGDALGRSALLLPDRGAHGGCDRRRPPSTRAARQPGGGRGRGHQ